MKKSIKSIIYFSPVFLLATLEISSSFLFMRFKGNLKAII